MTDIELFGWQRRIATASVDELLGIIDEMQDPEAKVLSTSDPDQMARLARRSLMMDTERLLSLPPQAPCSGGGRARSYEDDGRGDRYVRVRRTVDLTAYNEACRIEDEYDQFRADLEAVRELAEQRLEHIRYRSSVRYRPAVKSPLQAYIDELQ